MLAGNNPDEEEIEEMIDEADEDGSGSINFPEFIGLMMKKQQGGQTKDDIKQVRLRDGTRESKDITKHLTVWDGDSSYLKCLVANKYVRNKSFNNGNA